ncbi:unnamed protein product [Chrysoparadoxa australica]
MTSTSQFYLHPAPSSPPRSRECSPPEGGVTPRSHSAHLMADEAVTGLLRHAIRNQSSCQLLRDALQLGEEDLEQLPRRERDNSFGWVQREDSVSSNISNSDHYGWFEFADATLQLEDAKPRGSVVGWSGCRDHMEVIHEREVMNLGFHDDEANMRVEEVLSSTLASGHFMVATRSFRLLAGAEETKMHSAITVAAYRVVGMPTSQHSEYLVMLTEGPTDYYRAWLRYSDFAELAEQLKRTGGYTSSLLAWSNVLRYPRRGWDPLHVQGDPPQGKSVSLGVFLGQVLFEMPDTKPLREFVLKRRDEGSSSVPRKGPLRNHLREEVEGMRYEDEQ